METLNFLMQGFDVATRPTNLLVALFGAFVGTVVGLLPGLGPINGVALLLPLAFALGLPPETALILLAAVYLGCEYGGRISAILLNVPGDAAAVMTTLDGYPLARQGKAGIALSLSAVSSFIGSIIATCGVVLFAPLLAKWAVAFGPAEYFVLMIFAIACLGGMVGDKPVKTLMAALMGLALATVGVDSTTGVYRFTFGSVSLSDGIQFVIVVIGFFSVSEILLMLEKTHSGQKAVKASGRLLFNFKEFCLTFWTMVRSAVAGFVIGTLPGAGATIASAMTYMSEKRLAGASGKFGEGDLRGLAAPEAANNASACGSLIPMLTLGVPGSGTTAVMIGALTLYNITPGPVLFDAQPALVWGLIASMFIANVMLLVLNLPLVGLWVQLLKIPLPWLYAGILVFATMGTIAANPSVIELLLLSGFGVLGFLMRRYDYPVAPVIVGLILGPMADSQFRRALQMSQGDPMVFFQHPGSVVMIALATIALVAPFLFRGLARFRADED